MQQTRKGLGPIYLIGIIALGVVAGGLVMNSGVLDNIPALSGASTPGGDGGQSCGFADAGEIAFENCGSKGTVEAAAFDQASDSSTEVATQQHAIQLQDGEEDIYLGAKESAPGSRASYSVSRGDQVKLLAFNDSYAYGTVTEQTVTKETHNVNTEVLNSMSSAPLLEVYDENNDKITGSQAFGSGQTKTWQRVRIQADASDEAFNLGLIALKANGTTVDFDDTELKDSAVSEIDCPDTYSGYDTCYSYTPRVGLTGDLSNVMQDWSEVNLDSLTVSVAEGEDPSNTEFTVAVDDYAPYIDEEQPAADRFQAGVVDEDGNDVGESDTTTTITLS